MGLLDRRRRKHAHDVEVALEPVRILREKARNAGGVVFQAQEVPIGDIDLIIRGGEGLIEDLGEGGHGETQVIVDAVTSKPLTDEEIEARSEMLRKAHVDHAEKHGGGELNFQAPDEWRPTRGVPVRLRDWQRACRVMNKVAKGLYPDEVSAYIDSLESEKDRKLIRSM